MSFILFFFIGRNNLLIFNEINFLLLKKSCVNCRYIEQKKLILLFKMINFLQKVNLLAYNYNY